MVYEHILFEVSENIATVTLNRPDALNAYQPKMGDELVDAFGRAREDDGVRAVVLTGAGRAFCAGVDLKFMKEHAARIHQGEDLVPLGEEHFVKGFAQDLAAFPKPVIAAINGPAVGVGVTMSLPCDIRIAAEDAKLGVTFTKLGMIPGLGATHFLPRIVGLAKALELVLTARLIKGPEAERIGLVNRVVPADQLLVEARKMAAMTAECDPRALAAAKQALHFGSTATLAEAMESERERSGSLRGRRSTD
jgi:2-(1,2-epoxy-1,2-dihydrophenyl)acetyl-CoA isomerase